MLYDAITGVAVAYGVGSASHETIDARGIVEATKLAMREAISSMGRQPDALLVDAELRRIGNYGDQGYGKLANSRPIPQPTRAPCSR